MMSRNARMVASSLALLLTALIHMPLIQGTDCSGAGGLCGPARGAAGGGPRADGV